MEKYQERFNLLNNDQKEAVMSDGNCLVLATAGSGKTETMAVKAARLINEGNIVGAVTFTKDAAEELKERILSYIAPELRKNLLVGTFHSMFFRMLKKRPQILSDADRNRYVAAAIIEHELEINLKDAVRIIDQIQQHEEPKFLDPTHKLIYESYQYQVQQNGQMDFSDMVKAAVSGLDNGTIEPYPFQYLLVDEMQDIDPLQLRWVLKHYSAGAIVTMVGDDDQSIYSFRNAMGLGAIDQFVAATNAAQVVLGMNYRSHAEILQVASNVITQNISRIPKHIQSAKGPGGEVQVKRFPKPLAEAVWIAEGISELKSLDPSIEIAVLSRNNRHLDAVESLLRSASIQYYRPADKSIFSQPEIGTYFNLLETIVGSKKNVGVEALLRYMDIDKKDSEKIIQMGVDNFKDRPRADLLAYHVSDSAIKIYRELCTLIKQWRVQNEAERHSLVINGVAEWMIAKLAINAENQKKVIESVCTALDRLNGPINKRTKYLTESDNNKSEPGAVILSTLHGSKGLQWDAVFMIRCEDTVFPAEGTSIEEERRLFFVGLTRAKRQCYVSHTSVNERSLFVAEMKQ
ncbi:ATP-dependent helicase [Flavobacterium sp.]|uniref:ATP-dependent helicase n=1 Tax=Flavobacterium sp. TaxID=239 RepID=UPI002635B04B|nr:ATP-dependent helicase [Flavobacterium sp.]